ncbi:MAG: hypothetical protein QXO97_05160 [Candidatus Nezhaarchaeales archaeon]
MAQESMTSRESASDVSDAYLAELFYRLFEKLLYSSLGESAGRAVLLLLRKSLQQDVGKALWENPKKVYDELLKIFGEGTKVLINIIVFGIKQVCKLDINSEDFIELMQSENQNSVEKLRSIMRLIAKSYKEQS